MKKLITILLLVVSLNSFGQYNVDRSDKYIALGLVTSSIIFDAMADGFRDDGRLLISHSFEAASILPLLISPFVLDLKDYQWASFLLTYVTMRVAIFDPIYNTTRGLPIGYIGDSSAWDRTIKKMTGPGSSWLLGARSLSFVVSVSIPIKYY
jgi:hypothetical protein